MFKPLTLILSLFLSSCFFKADEVELSDDLLNELNSNQAAKDKSANQAKITNVEIVGNQVKVTGTKLNGVQSVKITGPNGFNESLSIDSKSSDTLIADVLKHVAFVSNTVFQLIVTDAYGASAFQLVFTIQDGAVTTAKLDDNSVDGTKIAPMNASEGDVLTFNQTSGDWEARPLSGQKFVGSWDSQNNTPTLSDEGSSTTPEAGEYYIVTNSGGGNVTVDGENGWQDGDWIIF